jgi:hypothetical protein
MASISNLPIYAFIQHNFIYIIVAGIGIFLFYEFVLKGGGKQKPKVIIRSDLEKKRRIEELKYNGRVIPIKARILNLEKNKYNEETFYPIIKYLWHGTKLIGSISNICIKEENPTNEIFYEVIFKPIWFWKFTNPFSNKKEIIRLSSNNIEPLNRNKNFIDIMPEVSLDMHMGTYYDVPNEKKNINLINENIWKHDKEANSSFYEVESQKRATFDIETAAQLDLKEKEIQAELIRKKGFTERV